MSNDTFRDYLNNKLGSIDSHVSELIPDTEELRSMRLNNPELYRDFIDRWLTTIDDHIVDIINGGGIHPGPTPPTPTIYDYYFEDIPCLDSSPFRTVINLHDTFSIFRTSEIRDWEAIINFENRQTDNNERSPFGITEGSGFPSIELYVKGQNSDTCIYHKYVDGTSTKHVDIIGTGNLNNTDIIFKKTGSNLDILVNNSVVLTIPFNLSRNDNNQNATLGVYNGSSTNFYFVGIINKFAFRWL